MRRFPLVPGQSGGGFRQTIVMPLATAPASCPAASGAQWKDLAGIATVEIVDNLGSAAAYSGGVYSVLHGSSPFENFCAWSITVPESAVPVAYRIVLLSGSLGHSNIGTAFVNNIGDVYYYLITEDILRSNLNTHFAIDTNFLVTFVFVDGGDYIPTTFRIEYLKES